MRIWKTTTLATAAVIVVGLVAAVSSASAAVDTSCWTNGTEGAWTSAKGYSYVASAKWCINQDNSNYEERLVWQSDGNLVVYSAAHSGGSQLWSSGTAGRGAKLNFQSDGNVVIYDAHGKAIWWMAVAPVKNTFFRLWLYPHYFGTYVLTADRSHWWLYSDKDW